MPLFPLKPSRVSNELQLEVSRALRLQQSVVSMGVTHYNIPCLVLLS